MLLFTNGRLPWQECALPNETSLMAAVEKRGIPPSAIKTTIKVENTAEEANAVSDELLGSSATAWAGKIILVTSAYHMLRARLLFEKAGFAVIPFPTDYKVCRRHSATILDFIICAEGLEMTEKALREVYGYAYYKVLGVRF